MSINLKTISDKWERVALDFLDAEGVLFIGTEEEGSVGWDHPEKGYHEGFESEAEAAEDAYKVLGITPPHERDQDEEWERLWSRYGRNTVWVSTAAEFVFDEFAAKDPDGAEDVKQLSEEIALGEWYRADKDGAPTVRVEDVNTAINIYERVFK